MLESFLLACTVMGVGIGIDVAIATAVRAQSLQKDNMVVFWIAGVTLTHTVFPMAGYLLTYFSIQSLPMITPLVGIVASGLIAWFLFNELFSKEENEENHHIMLTLGIILAVSWDALWSGPAKSAQVVGWNDLLIWLSFGLVGLVVMGFALTALKLASMLCQITHLKEKALFILLWVQYSVISYFGLLALARYTFASDASEIGILTVAALFSFILMMIASFQQQPQRA